MTALAYSFVVRDSTAGGARVAGLTPGFVLFKKLSDNSDITPPTILEVGEGAYKFAYDPAANGEAIWQADAGASLTVAGDRYIDGTATLALQLQSGDVSAVTGGAASGVLDAALSGHAGAGTAGAALGALVGVLAESYAANGQPATMAQLLYGILAILGNVSQSGASLVAKKLDGSTPAMTFTLDNPTAPTSRVRTA
jgi:hypothetical protein